jgi:hypothetical protein
VWKIERWLVTMMLASIHKELPKKEEIDLM